MILLEIFGLISELSILIPVVVYFIKKKPSATEIRILMVYIFIILTRNIISVGYNIAYTFFHLKGYNLVFYNWTSVLGFYVLSYLYYRLIKSIFWKKAIIAFWGIFAISTFLDIQNGTLFDIKTASFNKYSFAVSGILILTIVLAYMYEVLKDLLIENILKFPYFWLSAGCMTYFGGTLLMFIYLLSANNQQGMLSWSFDIFLSSIFNCAMALTIWHAKQPNLQTK